MTLVGYPHLITCDDSGEDGTSVLIAINKRRLNERVFVVEELDLHVKLSKLSARCALRPGDLASGLEVPAHVEERFAKRQTVHRDGVDLERPAGAGRPRVRHRTRAVAERRSRRRVGGARGGQRGQRAEQRDCKELTHGASFGPHVGVGTMPTPL